MTPRQQAFDFFVHQGWTPPQSAGIVANLEAESGLRPDAVGDGGSAYGIAQWHPDRQANFAGLMGRPIQGSTLENQLYFVHAELQRWEKKAGDALAACTTPAEAGACVSKMYERPGDKEGEAAKRAARAEQLLAQCGSTAQNAPGDAIAPADVPTQQAAPEVAPQPTTTENAMPVPIALALRFLPDIIGMVPGLNKIPGLAEVATAIPMTGAAGGSPHAADYLPLVQAIIGAFKRAVPGATNEQDAVAKAQADPTVAAAAAQAVLSTPDVAEQLNKLVPVLDKIHQYEKDGWAADEDSKDRAAARYAPPPGEPTYDPAILLTRSSIYMVGFLTFFLCVCIAIQFWQGKPVGTELWAAFAGMIGWITAKLGTIFDNRFGSSRQSAAKDVTISQLANK